MTTNDRVFRFLIRLIGNRLNKVAREEGSDAAVVRSQRLRKELEMMETTLIQNSDTAWDMEANRGNH